MRITIEPTGNYPNLLANEHPASVSIMIPSDELDLKEMFETLIIPALLGAGWTQETINKYLNNEH